MREHLEELLGEPVGRVHDLGASHAWTLHRAELRDGREVFVKALPRGTSSGVFAAEVAGLRWLGEAGPGAPLPDVLAADERMLVLPWLPSEPPSVAAAGRFGRALAELHADSPGAFGAPWDGYIADLPLDNTLDEGPWARWYAERRLAPFLRQASEHLSRSDVRLVERVIDKIEELAGPAEKPARIHGDLWSGNVQWTGGAATLIDPAAHGGHRETDLAMLALFGCPHLDRILAAYNESHPLSEGWRARVPLHQLHPLLVHVCLFGASYRSQTVQAAEAALALR
ncbi:fructosamine kinase family protein [Actinomadura rupiterrae]|uniref:fructosamine kinase family protein n=1 Tax=Actinomadura rupiterrae TaxID=559627 RepID=UPI0020A4B217|nr:fructosamine kinase family protein [Actinomadura rupiterrae]MCP2342920.1 fructosamine-3-kinase [Actinomadura rupiterrae]